MAGASRWGDVEAAVAPQVTSSRVVSNVASSTMMSAEVSAAAAKAAERVARAAEAAARVAETAARQVRAAERAAAEASEVKRYVCVHAFHACIVCVLACVAVFQAGTGVSHRFLECPPRPRSRCLLLDGVVLCVACLVLPSVVGFSCCGTTVVQGDLEKKAVYEP